MRVLGRIRLSRSSEESTSVERQRELIENWAKTNNHEIVAWAEDVDVSGAISPFDTPALGPYLKEPASNEWDILVAWKLEVPRVLFLGNCLDFYYFLRRVLLPKIGFHFDWGSVSQALVKPRVSDGLCVGTDPA